MVCICIILKAGRVKKLQSLSLIHRKSKEYRQQCEHYRQSLRYAHSGIGSDTDRMKNRWPIVCISGQNMRRVTVSSHDASYLIQNASLLSLSCYVLASVMKTTALSTSWALMTSVEIYRALSAETPIFSRVRMNHLSTPLQWYSCHHPYNHSTEVPLRVPRIGTNCYLMSEDLF